MPKLSRNLMIITTQPGAADTAMGELQKINPGARVREVLSAEARLVEFPPDANVSGEALDRLIFIRHLFPVHWLGEMDSPKTGWPKTGLPEWIEILPTASAKDSPAKFSVQLRVVPGRRGEQVRGLNSKSSDSEPTSPRDEVIFARAKELVAQAEGILTLRGFEKDDSHPEWALSFFVSANQTLYAGWSSCAQNLSDWNGGAARFKKEESFISRAEFKLLEAFALLKNAGGLHLPAKALDLGAAPGGWTRALLNMGCDVTAVDPAAMHESLTGHPKLTHIRAPIQQCRFEGEPFGLITNDMRMDMFESAKIMLGAARHATPGALAVMTLKLSPGHWLQKTAKAIKLLEAEYENIRARQLFHNRDEVTVFMYKR